MPSFGGIGAWIFSVDSEAYTNACCRLPSSAENDVLVDIVKNVQNVNEASKYFWKIKIKSSQGLTASVKR